MDVVNEALEIEQGGMALVAVIEPVADTEFLEHEHTADAEKVFLLDAVFPVAAI